MLNVVIGLVLVFLLYSLFATTILELLASFLSLRGRNLEKALRNMLDSDESKFFQQFKENPLYRQLGGHFVGKTSPPSYLPTEKFRSILFHLLNQGKAVEGIEESIAALPDSPLKTILGQLWDDARHDRDVFNQKVELWFDDVMDRASGWYKRNIQRILILLGIGIAVTFNVDSVQIYRQLALSPEVAHQLAEEAVKVVEERQENDGSLRKQSLDTLAQTLKPLSSSPIGIGWDEMSLATMSGWAWVIKIFGWLVTAVAISLGAPFWFDLLRKMVNIRSSGKAVD